MNRKFILSNTGLYLFTQAYKSNIPKYGCLKQIVLDLFTTEYDKSLNDTFNNMKCSSIKIYEFIKNSDKIKTLNQNAINNIIILILTNGETTITPLIVKKNIRFYIDLAFKAMKNEDHQTAIVILSALQNKHIIGLNINYNKSMKNKLNKMFEKYGYLNDNYLLHLIDIYKKYIISNYIPSTKVINYFINKDKLYLNLSDIINLKNLKYKNSNYKLCPLYITKPTRLLISKSINNNKLRNINDLLSLYYSNIQHQINLKKLKK